MLEEFTVAYQAPRFISTETRNFLVGTRSRTLSGDSFAFGDVNSATRPAEKEKIATYRGLCTERGIAFVPIILTTTSEVFQRNLLFLGP